MMWHITRRQKSFLFLTVRGEKVNETFTEEVTLELSLENEYSVCWQTQAEESGLTGHHKKRLRGRGSCEEPVSQPGLDSAMSDVGAEPERGRLGVYTGGTGFLLYLGSNWQSLVVLEAWNDTYSLQAWQRCFHGKIYLCPEAVWGVIHVCNSTWVKYGMSLSTCYLCLSLYKPQMKTKETITETWAGRSGEAAKLVASKVGLLLCSCWSGGQRFFKVRKALLFSLHLSISQPPSSPLIIHGAIEGRLL